MPTKTKNRKGRCCTRCHKKTQGHIGPVGRRCTAEVVPEEEKPDVKKPDKKRGPKGKSVEVSDAESEVSVSETESESASSSSDESSSELGNLRNSIDSLAGQMSVLAETVTGLVAREVSRVKVTEVTEVSSRKSQRGTGKSSSDIERLSVDKRGKTKLSNTKSLSKDKELAVLLKAYNKDEREFLDELGSGAGDGAASSLGEKIKKTLYIHDYITPAASTLDDAEDTLQGDRN
jgi:hypothetical protein